MQQPLKLLTALCSLLASALAIGVSVHSQENNQCGDLEVTLQRTQCYRESLKKVDEENSKLMGQLQQIYKNNKDKQGDDDLNDDTIKWNAFVSRHCGIFARRFEGGSESAVAATVCSFRMAVQRKNELTLLVDDAAPR